MIADDIAEALPELRAQAVSLMRDTVLVERADGAPIVDDKGNITPSWRTIYTGPCRVVPTVFKDTTQGAGETVFDLSDARIALPITAEAGAIRNGDRATITAVDQLLGDPANVGRVFTLQRDPDRTHPVERRFSAQEVS